MPSNHTALQGLRTRFDDAAREFSAYDSNTLKVRIIDDMGRPCGPYVPRFDVRHTKDGPVLQPFDQAEEPIPLYGPKMAENAVEIAAGWVDAYWLFRTLATELNPVLQRAGVKFRDGEGATPDGQVLFWAIGQEPPKNRINVVPNVNPFLLVGLAIDRLVAELPEAVAVPPVAAIEPQQAAGEGPDLTAYVNAKTLWHDKFLSFDECKKFLVDHPEIQQHQEGQRRMVHAGDWARVWAKLNRAGFEKLDESAEKPVVPDSVSTPQYLENAIKLFGAIGQGKKNVVRGRK